MPFRWNHSGGKIILDEAACVKNQEHAKDPIQQNDCPLFLNDDRMGIETKGDWWNEHESQIESRSNLTGDECHRGNSQRSYARKQWHRTY